MRREALGRMMLAGVCCAAGLASVPVLAQPANDSCASATVIAAGVPVTGTTIGATIDGESDCNLQPTPDVYHKFTPAVAGVYTLTLCTGGPGENWDSALSLHAGCPADLTTQIACDDEGCRPPGATDFGYASSIAISLPAGVEFTVRVSGFDTNVPGVVYTLLVVGPAAPVGACCIFGQCSVATASVCGVAGGAYRGDWSTCELPANNTTAYAANMAPTAIPDNSPAGLSRTIDVPDNFVMGDVRLEADISHPFCGDLTVTLTHGGHTATIMRRLGGGAFGDDSNLSGTYSFSDGGASTIWQGAVAAADTTSVVSNGVFRAADEYANTVSLRGVFAGTSSSGPWVLSVSDNGALDSGMLNGWRLVLDRSAGDPCATNTGACCVGSTCQQRTAAACTGPNHRFTAVGVACNVAGNNSTPCCRSDFNQSGMISVQDVFDFLTAYFTQNPIGDYNGGGLSVQDLFDFLTGFFGGCGV